MSYIHYDYSTNVLTNTFEQYTIAMNSKEPLQNKTLDEMVELARELIFDFDYPFYTLDLEAKNTFETTFILTHYRDNWGVETSGEFKFWLKNRLTLVMDEYTQLYNTMHYEYDPVTNHSLTRTIERDGNENTSGTSQNSSNTNGSNSTNAHSNNSQSYTNNADNQSIHSDNPQVNFSGTDYASTMDRGNNNQKSNTNGVSNTNTSGNFSQSENGNASETGNKNFKNNETFTEKGYLGNVQDAITKERNLIININRKLIDECSDLFFSLII